MVIRMGRSVGKSTAGYETLMRLGRLQEEMDFKALQERALNFIKAGASTPSWLIRPIPAWTPGSSPS